MKHGQWIWAPVDFEENQYVIFESAFELEDTQNVLISISVSGEYALYINDQWTGFGQFGDWPTHKTFNTHDIASSCVAGHNRLMLKVWHMGIDCMVALKGEGRVCFEVIQDEKVLARSGPDTQCRMDGHYRMGCGVPRITSQLGFSFEYDALGCDGDLMPVKCCPEPKRMRMRPVPLLKLAPLAAGKRCFQGYFIDQISRKAPSGMRMLQSALACVPDLDLRDGWMEAASGDGLCLIYDLGREYSGYFSMAVELDEDCEILIGWGEHLKDLRVRTAVGGRNFCAVYRGKPGMNHFVHPFRRMGCRYIQLHVYARRIRVEHVGLLPVVYPLAHQPSLVIADGLHQRIYDTAVETLKLCVHDHYEGCPWREQALYAMDNRIQVLCGYYAFGETKMPRACIELLAEGQRADGLLEICAPAKAPITIPGFSLAWVVELYEYVRHTGDTQVEDLMDCVGKIFDAMEKRRIDGGGCVMRFHEAAYWNFHEWQPGLDGHGPRCQEAGVQDGLLTGWYAIALHCAARLWKILGRNDEASALECRLTEVRKAIDGLWNEERGAYVAFMKDGAGETESALMQALVLLSGACPEKRAAFIRKRLKTQRGLIPVTLNDALIRYEALMQDEATYADFVFEDIGRIWGNMLMNGATSFWETALGEADFHNAGSLCHGWSAVPVYFYHAYGLGLRPEIPGEMKRHTVYQTMLEIRA